MTHVLFVSRQRLEGATSGSSSYLLQLAETVRRAGQIPHLIQPSPTIMGRRPVLRFDEEMAVFDTHGIRGVLQFGKFAVSFDPGVWLDALRGILARTLRRIGVPGSWLRERPRPYAVALPWTDADRTYLRRHSSFADVVIADYMFQAEAFETLPVPSIRTAIVMHDLFHRRLPVEGIDSVSTVTRHEELSMLSRAGAVIAIQPEEAEFVRRHIAGSQVILAPMAARVEQACNPGKSDSVLFVGSRTAPNTEGLKWFLDEVWPALRRQRPASRLDVVGSVCADFIPRDHGNVRWHGVVDDLGKLYRESGIVISPLRFGSGLKVKLVEALGYGKAIVATDVTLQGVDNLLQGAVIRANGAEDFSRALASLLGDRDARIRLGNAALDAARKHFAVGNAHQAFERWLESVTRTHVPQPARA